MGEFGYFVFVNTTCALILYGLSAFPLTGPIIVFVVSDGVKVPLYIEPEFWLELVLFFTVCSVIFFTCLF